MTSETRGRIRIWNGTSTAETGRFAGLIGFRGHKEDTHCVAWSRDWSVLATGSNDNRVRAWRQAPKPLPAPRSYRSIIERESEWRFDDSGEKLDDVDWTTYRWSAVHWKSGRGKFGLGDRPDVAPELVDPGEPGRRYARARSWRLVGSSSR